MRETSLINLIPTAEATQRLNIKRQEFLTLKKFLGIRPMGKKRLNGKTPSHLYDPRDIEHLRQLGERSRTQGFGASQ